MPSAISMKEIPLLHSFHFFSKPKFYFSLFHESLSQSLCSSRFWIPSSKSSSAFSSFFALHHLFYTTQPSKLCMFLRSRVEFRQLLKSFQWRSIRLWDCDAKIEKISFPQQFFCVLLLNFFKISTAFRYEKPFLSYSIRT